MSSRFRGHDARIQQIFGVDFKDTSRRMLTLDIYKNYLAKNLNFPVDVCGREDFSWEEFYLIYKNLSQCLVMRNQAEKLKEDKLRPL